MSVERYTRTAVLLHWLVALLVLGLFPLGLYMADLPLSPTKLKLYSYHKWAGVTVFALALLRLLWRLRHAPPPLPASQPAWQRRAAHAGHLLLYGFMFAVPLSGWLMSSAYGFTTVWFGVLPLPDLLDKNEALGDALKLVHRYLNYAFMALVAGHILAAFKHQWIDRDGTLDRMSWVKQESSC
ncbi:MAG: cytochrome b [Pseudomonadota bacterium]|nr:MAG: cytochrome b [Pseudomonadota bacterium]